MGYCEPPASQWCEMDRLNAIDLVERSSEPAFAIDGAHRIVAWNACATRLWGLSHESTIGRNCYALFSSHTPDGCPLCGPHCRAGACFQRDQPFSSPCVMTIEQAGVTHAVHASSIVLPGAPVVGVPKAIVFLSPLDALPHTPVGTACLRVQALGPLRLETGGVALEWQRWPRRPAATLFKYLLTRRGCPVHREVLVEALWPDSPFDAGMGRLKVLVHTLRRCLEPQLSPGAASAFVVTEGECYRLPTGSHLWVDVDQFTTLSREGARALEHGQHEAAMRAFTAAASLYHGEYLQDDPYSDWLAPERGLLREQYITLLVGLATLHAAARNVHAAIAACRSALALDPCRESVHRILMSCLWEAGRRSEAVYQYHVCREVLARELGLSPLPETTALLQEILQDDAPSSPAPVLMACREKLHLLGDQHRWS